MFIKFVYSIQDFDNPLHDVQILYNDRKEIVLLKNFELS